MIMNKHLDALDSALADLIKDETDTEKAIKYATLKSELDNAKDDLEKMEQSQVELVKRFNQVLLEGKFKPLNDHEEKPSEPQAKSFDEIVSETLAKQPERK